MSLLEPISHALAAVLAATHHALDALGAPPDAAGTWLLGIASLVVIVRLALLPLVVQGLRQAHAAARARPHLRGVGAMGPGLVSSFGAASVLGVSLAGHGYLGSGGVHLAVVAGLAVTAAALSYVTQRFVVAPNTPVDGMPEAMLAAQRIMPVVSAGGLLLAGGVVPVALLVYWVCSSAWTLGQSVVIARWFPTPGTAAAARRA